MPVTYMALSGIFWLISKVRVVSFSPLFLNSHYFFVLFFSLKYYHTSIHILILQLISLFSDTCSLSPSLPFTSNPSIYSLIHNSSLPLTLNPLLLFLVFTSRFGSGNKGRRSVLFFSKNLGECVHKLSQALLSATKVMRWSPYITYLHLHFLFFELLAYLLLTYY